MSRDVDLSRADLNLLVVFESVLELGHVGRAAERLNLTPSAVSHALGRLRRMLNDPLFLRTLSGVAPTERALSLAPAIAEVLHGARRVIAAASPFDPATSERRFTLGAPAAEPMLVLPALVGELQRRAPRVTLGVRPLMPLDTLAALDANDIQVAVNPLQAPPPPRFAAVHLFSEDFVTLMRAGHPHAEDPSLESYCRWPHAVMSHTGEFSSPLDAALAEMGRERRVVLTLPSYMSLLAALEGSELLAAAPRTIALRYASRFGLTWTERPLKAPVVEAYAVTTRAAMDDAGVAWLMVLIRDLSSELRHRAATPGSLGVQADEFVV